MEEVEDTVKAVVESGILTLLPKETMVLSDTPRGCVVFVVGQAFVKHKIRLESLSANGYVNYVADNVNRGLANEFSMAAGRGEIKKEDIPPELLPFIP